MVVMYGCSKVDCGAESGSVSICSLRLVLARASVCICVCVCVRVCVRARAGVYVHVYAHVYVIMFSSGEPWRLTLTPFSLQRRRKG
jgi:hypothetical protein